MNQTYPNQYAIGYRSIEEIVHVTAAAPLLETRNIVARGGHRPAEDHGTAVEWTGLQPTRDALAVESCRQLHDWPR